MKRARLGKMNLISDAAGVDALVRRVRDAGRYALDFEFLWEKTYAPLPCLAQIAVEGEIFLVDPIEGAPLEPIAQLVDDPEVSVVMHAPSADLTLLAMAHGVRPANLEDVQLLAGFVGMGAGQGLGALMSRVLDVSIDKGERYTDWSRRPLRDAQLDYAAADVADLIELADELWSRAEESGRAAWVREEIVRRFGPDTRWMPEPSRAWRKVKGQGRLNSRDRATLATVAEWREKRAAAINRPASWVVPDRTLIEIARRKPADVAALRRERGLPDQIKGAEAERLIDAVARGASTDPIGMPAAPPSRVLARLDVLGPLSQVIISARANAEGIAPSLIATRDEIHNYLIARITGDGRESPLASGWRHEIAGSALDELTDGRLSLTPLAEPPYLREDRNAE